MTLDERAAAVLNDIANTVDSETSRAIIRRALTEQDKISRHAAAEEVNMVCEHMEYDGLIDKDHAFAAVMNCRGGVI